MNQQKQDPVIVNTAVIPVSKLEDDFYDWWGRHADVLRVKDAIDPEIVLIGDSITHLWGGEPEANQCNGARAFESVFAPYRVLNLGFGWDRTQNVLWRIEHGELDGLHPHTVILHIGTNNTGSTPSARANTAEEIVEGIAAICAQVKSKIPGVTILLMKVFPREEMPTHSRRVLIGEINDLLAEFAQKETFLLIDLTPQMLTFDGCLPQSIAPDFCHPNEEGYRIWADALRSALPPPKRHDCDLL